MLIKGIGERCTKLVHVNDWNKGVLKIKNGKLFFIFYMCNQIKRETLGSAQVIPSKG